MNLEAIKKSLGKRRLEKIQEINLESEYETNDFLDIMMKRPYINSERETIVLATWESETETRKNWLDYVKYRIDEMEHNPELWDAQPHLKG